MARRLAVAQSVYHTSTNTTLACRMLWRMKQIERIAIIRYAMVNYNTSKLTTSGATPEIQVVPCDV
eukprot:1997052-Amphidinium_carterae.1